MKQLHEGPTKPAPELLMPVTVRQTGWSKPFSGGLWTSSLRDDGISSWVEWCFYESGFCVGDGWILLPRKNARIYTVNNLADLERLQTMFPLQGDYIDFVSMAKNYDALHLTEQGQRETSISFPVNLSGWDCESTVWFRWVFESVQGPVNIKKPRRNNDDSVFR